MEENFYQQIEIQQKLTNKPHADAKVPGTRLSRLSWDYRDNRTYSGDWLQSVRSAWFACFSWFIPDKNVETKE